MLRKNLYADLLKMKGTPIAFAHILIPVITSGLFLIYYSFSAWNENTKIIFFYHTVGEGFPVLIGIFTASMMEQEQNAGEFQNMLALQKRRRHFCQRCCFYLFLVCLQYY